MSSTTSPETGFFAAPRKQRWLMWISGAVLVVGIAGLTSTGAGRLIS